MGEPCGRFTHDDQDGDGGSQYTGPEHLSETDAASCVVCFEGEGQHQFEHQDWLHDEHGAEAEGDCLEAVGD